MTPNGACALAIVNASPFRNTFRRRPLGERGGDRHADVQPDEKSTIAMTPTPSGSARPCAIVIYVRICETTAEFGSPARSSAPRQRCAHRQCEPRRGIGTSISPRKPLVSRLENNMRQRARDPGGITARLSCKNLDTARTSRQPVMMKISCVHRCPRVLHNGKPARCGDHQVDRSR